MLCFIISNITYHFFPKYGFNIFKVGDLYSYILTFSQREKNTIEVN